MPSLEVRQRRSRAAEQGKNDIEGGAQQASGIDEYLQQRKNLKSQSNSEEQLPDNFVLRMLVLYPGLLLVFVFIIFVMLYKALGLGH